MEEFRREKREIVARGAIVDFCKDYVRVPNGNLAEWDFIRHKGAAAIVAEDEEGKILLVRQYRNALDRYTLEIPAGGRNGDEDMKICAMRELEEETGYKPGKTEHLIDIFTTVAFCNEKIGIYCTNELIPSKQNLDEDEFIHVERYTIPQLEQMILEGVIQDSKTISAILAYKAKKGME